MGEDKQLRCNTCYKVFGRRANLMRHMRLHTGQKPYKCAECRATFALKSNLTQHMFFVHTDGEKKFQCAVCNKKLKTHVGLKQKLYIEKTMLQLKKSERLARK